MRIATWNINSIRLRIANVIRFVQKYNVDVLCLQETKTEDKFFPIDELKEIGMDFCNFRGEKSYNGVAILSKIPVLDQSYLNWCELNDARHISVKLKNNIIIHNFYVPAGGDVPDVTINKKFDHKIRFVREMMEYFKK